MKKLLCTLGLHEIEPLCCLFVTACYGVRQDFWCARDGCKWTDTMLMTYG
jgi:hypothetical protein